MYANWVPREALIHVYIVECSTKGTNIYLLNYLSF